MNPNNRDLAETWLKLMQEKKIFAKNGWQKVSKDDIFPEAISCPEVIKSLEKNGYYVRTLNCPQNRINALEYLTRLGYVQKTTNDTVHHVPYTYVIHPYRPIFFPSTGWGITNVTESKEGYDIFLDSRDYLRFLETASKFKDQVGSGRHHHITRFEYYEDYNYESDVYEIKDKFLDAIYLSYNKTTDELTVWLSEPSIKTSGTKKDKKVKKIWKTIGNSINLELFHEGEGAIDEEVDSLPWKKRYDGIIVYKGNIHYHNSKESANEGELRGESFMTMPDYLNVVFDSYENRVSNRFEEAVRDYLVDNCGYPQAAVGYKPPYLPSSEIDVYAERGLRQREIVVCECKFRKFKGRNFISTADLYTLIRNKRIIEEKEKERVNVRQLHFWLVTNEDKIDKVAMEEANKEGIKIMCAEVNSRAERRANFRVIAIRKL